MFLLQSILQTTHVSTFLLRTSTYLEWFRRQKYELSVCLASPRLAYSHVRALTHTERTICTDPCMFSHVHQGWHRHYVFFY